MREIIQYRIMEKEYGGHTGCNIPPDAEFHHVMWEGTSYIFSLTTDNDLKQKYEMWKIRILEKGMLWPEEKVLATGQRGRSPIHLVGEKVDYGVESATLKDSIDA